MNSCTNNIYVLRSQSELSKRKIFIVSLLLFALRSAQLFINGDFDKTIKMMPRIMIEMCDFGTNRGYARIFPLMLDLCVHFMLAQCDQNNETKENSLNC